jgi:hypothetical protein
MKLKKLLQPSLQLNCNFNFYPICFVLHFHLENYIPRRFYLTPSHKKIHVNWDELIKGA